jgi:hypothetical protein
LTCIQGEDHIDGAFRFQREKLLKLLQREGGSWMDYPYLRWREGLCDEFVDEAFNIPTVREVDGLLR